MSARLPTPRYVVKRDLVLIMKRHPELAREIADVYRDSGDQYETDREWWDTIADDAQFFYPGR